MASSLAKHLQARQLDSTRAFSAIFGVLFGCLLVGTIIWACLWPRIQKKYLMRRFPSRTRHRDEFEMTQPTGARVLKRERSGPTFPSHPAVLHRDTEALPHPILGAFAFQTKHSSNDHALENITIKQPCLVHFGDSLANPYDTYNDVYDGARAGLQRPGTSYSDRTFGDAKDYILAVPEPLLLHNYSSQDSVDHPKPSFVLPIAQLCPSGATLHTGKVTAEESNDYPQPRRHSGLSWENFGLGEVQSQLSSISEVSTFGDDDKIDIEKEKKSGIQSTGATLSVADLSVSGSDNEDLPVVEHSKSIAALNRLKTYRSLTGAKPPRPLSRAGTITRPKTPVAEIRDRYNRAASDETFNVFSKSNIGTTSTQHTIRADSSQQASSTTCTSVVALENSSSPPSSPMQHQTCFADGQATQSDSTRELTIGSIPVLPPEMHHTLPYRSCIAPIRTQIIAAERSSQNRHIPPPLKFASHIPLATYRSTVVRPVDPTASMLNPLVHIHGTRVSSVYSRDTKGISITGTPVSALAVETAGLSPISPCFLGGLESGKQQHPQDLSSEDAVRLKVQNWSQHVGKAGLPPFAQ